MSGREYKEKNIRAAIHYSNGYKGSSVPYLPLDNYDISPEVKGLIPSHIAKKYCVIPIARVGDIVNVVMENPFNEEAIKALEDITGCIVRRFVGTHSEIMSAISACMRAQPSTLPELKIQDEDDTANELSGNKIEPYRANTPRNEKAERRASFRFKCKLNIYFPEEKSYVKSETIDISYHGVAFRSKKAIPVGTYLNVRIDLPEDVLSRPAAVLLYVVRNVRIDTENFCIGGKILKTGMDDIKQVVRHFSLRPDQACVSYKGLDRRKSMRYKADINLWFPVDDSYKRTTTEDISDDGLLFKSETTIPIGSYLPIEMRPIRLAYRHPIACLAEVTRAAPIQGGGFYIGVRWVKIYRNDIESIISYAGMHTSK